MKTFLILGGVVVLVLLGVYLYPFNNIYVAPTPVAPPGNVIPPPAPAYVPPENGPIEPTISLSKQADYIIDITTVGFSPDNITIKAGDSVIWTNRDRAPHHVATSAESTYSSNGPTNAVNSCGALKLGDSCKVTFTATGTWSYYDKLNSKFTGTVTVQ